MKKILVFLVFMLFITSVTIPVIGKIDDDYEKKRVNKMLQNGVDQEQTHQDGRGFTIFYGQSCAQGFVPTIDLLTAVQLYIFSGDDVASGYEITVSIRDDLDGDDLTSVTVNADQVGDYKWLSFDFPDIDITPGDKYYIVASSDDGGADVEETYAWFYGEGDLYSNGNPWTNYSDSGWQEAGGLQIVDFCFKTWFTEEVSNNLFEFKLIELFEDYTNIIRLFKYIF